MLGDVLPPRRYGVFHYREGASLWQARTLGFTTWSLTKCAGTPDSAVKRTEYSAHSRQTSHQGL